MKTSELPINLTQLRKQLYMNQKDFWGAIGVTQSAGSRYESGKSIPQPVSELLRLVYLEQLDLQKVNRYDMAIALFLKQDYPELYHNLEKSMLLVYKKDKTATPNNSVETNEIIQSNAYFYNPKAYNIQK